MPHVTIYEIWCSVRLTWVPLPERSARAFSVYAHAGESPARGSMPIPPIVFSPVRWS